MNRKVLLVEPNYRNKYPPMPLMKLATYYRRKGDDVRFYKGDLKTLAAELITEDLLNYLELEVPDVNWRELTPVMFKFVRCGKYADIEGIDVLSVDEIRDVLKTYRKKFKDKDYFRHPVFDIVNVTTLFTFYWDITIKTINFVKGLCKTSDGVMVGGVAATILPDEIEQATGIRPFCGPLNKPGMIDEGDNMIIDELPLDYSILEEIDYTYPAHDAYFAYMTRGCINHCAFCAVPKLEPVYCDYIGLKDQIQKTCDRFGERRDLLLLDNNVLASKKFDKIIDEIKSCGFKAGASYMPPDEYAITMKNLRDQYNDRAYIKKAVKLFRDTIDRLNSEEEKNNLYIRIEKAKCLYPYTATRKNILKLDEFVRPLYEKTHKPHRRQRVVDFNQGIDSRLVNSKNMSKLSEVNIRPLRIAFDHWELRDKYVASVEVAVNCGIKNLSNYLLYNFQDKPEELYWRMRMNVELCEKLDARIYSFPMKYHPIDDPQYFSNRDYIGQHWNRKFIRAVQAVLNSTKGKIGRGVEFFEEAFGENVDEFKKILWMPETFIIYRRIYDKNLRERLVNRYTEHTALDCDLANEWWKEFSGLSETQREQAENVIKNNVFDNYEEIIEDKDVLHVLDYYRITKG